MALTLKNARNRIVTRIGEQYGNPILNVKLNQFINDAIQQFYSEASWYFMAKTGSITLVDGTKEYSLASDLDKINDQEVRLGTGFEKIYFLNEKDFDQVIMSPTVGGTPEYFTLRGFQKIQLYPIPNSVAVADEASVSYEYFKLVTTALSADADLLDIPVKFEPVVLYLAESYAQNLVGSETKARFAYELYRFECDRAVEDNRKIVELGPRDRVKDQPADQRQSAGIDQRRV